LTTGAITGVLDRLEAAGYVRRVPDPTDRRRLTVEAEPSKLTALMGYVEPLVGRSAQLTREWSPATRRALAGYLDGLGSALGEEAERLRVSTRGGMIDGTYVAPRDDLSRARLVFISGAPRLSLGGAVLGQQVRMVAEAASTELSLSRGDGDELLRADFDGPPPDVRSADGTVTMRYRRRLIDVASRTADVALHPDVAWNVEVSGGITDLVADLRGLRLGGLDVRGGANHLHMKLGVGEGSVGRVLEGGARVASFERPRGVAVGLRVRGGVAHLRFDDRGIESVGGDLWLQSDDFVGAAHRYEIEIAGGVSELAVA
jgi:hypothetical protein